MLENLIYARPEMFLSVYAMLMLMLGVYRKGNPAIGKKLFAYAIAGLLITAYLLCSVSQNAVVNDKGVFQAFLFNRGFVFDNFAYHMKLWIILASVGSCVIAMNSKFYAGSNFNVFEFPVLLLLSVVGMFLLVSSGDLMTFYIGLELQSLALYVLVAINRDSEASTESGVKYFVLGALASGIILFGVSLIYGFSGSTNLGDIAAFLNTNSTLGTIPAGVVFGFVLVLAGLFFKLSAVPMHMWAPDVYEGSTKAVLSFIATAPKIAAVGFLIRLMASMDAAIFAPFGKIIYMVSAASMILSSFAALKQDNIKRLLAYSSIGNMGYILIALSIGTASAVQAGVFYLVIYMIGSVGMFAVISQLQNNDADLEKISDLAGLAKKNPLYSIALATFMFSVAGIPPMAGFMGKFFVFKEAISAGYITLALIGVVTSVVACFYYLKIIKTMYFDEAKGTSGFIQGGISLKLVIIASVAFTLLMIFFTSSVLEIAKQTTSSLF